jgi:DNA repair exonuclease SbcCD ATPase subunit
MNSDVTFPPPAPSLKLTRASAEPWAATLAEERRRLHEDQEMLREREENLREYEARLRAWQEELDTTRANATAAARPSATPTPFHRPSSRTPFADDAGLHVAWEKLHRARELLEAEQNHLREDRLALKEHLEQLRHREDAVAAREAQVAAREALIVAAAGKPVLVATESTPSAVSRLTRAPFDMARSVFGGRK